MNIPEIIRKAEEAESGGVLVGRPSKTPGWSYFTVPQAIEFAGQLPPVAWRDGQPIGWGLYPPLRSPVVVTMARDQTSQDPERQAILRTAQGWIVCMWSDAGKGRPDTMIRIGFNPSQGSKENRWCDIPEIDLGAIPATNGIPRKIFHWELRRL